MKKYGVLFLLLSTHLLAQSYIEFNNYWHSNKIVLYKGQSLKEVLITEGFDLSERDWVKITFLMNGLRSLSDIKYPKELYLPPKMTFEEYLKTKKKQKKLYY